MYNRLFTKILDSSIWLEPLATRVVWITLLASMDEDGMCTFACPANIARRAGVPLDECEAALSCLMSPDPNSSDPANDGRRLDKIEGGYLVLNAAKYRAIFSREIRREQTRKRVAKHRELVTQCNAPVTQANASVTQSEAEYKQSTSKAEAEKKERGASRPARPGLEEVKLAAAKIGLPEIEAEKFFSHYEANGWRVGRNPMKSWPHALGNWKRRAGQFAAPNSAAARADAARIAADKRDDAFLARLNASIAKP